MLLVLFEFQMCTKVSENNVTFCYVSLANDEVSQTENVGSIKAMKQARVLALARGKMATTTETGEQSVINKTKQKCKFFFICIHKSSSI